VDPVNASGYLVEVVPLVEDVLPRQGGQDLGQTPHHLPLAVDDPQVEPPGGQQNNSIPLTISPRQRMGSPTALTHAELLRCHVYKRCRHWRTHNNNNNNNNNTVVDIITRTWQTLYKHSCAKPSVFKPCNNESDARSNIGACSQGVIMVDEDEAGCTCDYSLDCRKPLLLWIIIRTCSPSRNKARLGAIYWSVCLITVFRS